MFYKQFDDSDTNRKETIICFEMDAVIGWTRRYRKKLKAEKTCKKNYIMIILTHNTIHGFKPYKMYFAILKFMAK